MEYDKSEFEGFTRSEATPCLNTVLGQKCEHLHARADGCRAPGADHDSMWCKDGVPVMYVTEPYGISFGHLQMLLQMCESRGLVAHISATHSGYNRGSSIAIRITRKGTPESRTLGFEGQTPWPLND